MTETHDLIFYHAPQSRAAGVLALFEELGVPYHLHLLNLRAGDSRKPEYLAVNPMGKVPAIVHKGVLVSEQPAIFLYLADAFSECGLAPAIGDPLRGAYLRWLVFYGSSLEPAVVDKFRKIEDGATSSLPYGSYDLVVKTVEDQLAKGPYFLGERFTAADVLWGSALRWLTMFGLFPKSQVTMDYIERVTSRPSFVRAAAKDAEFVALHEQQMKAAQQS